MVEHPNRRSVWKAFGRGDLQAPENRAIVRHLLTGCAACRDVGGEFLPPSFLGAARRRRSVWDARAPWPGGSENLDYTSAFAAVRRELGKRRLALASERRWRRRSCVSSAARPFDRQWMLATNDARFRTWAFCDLLLDTSREWGFQDPGRALELARARRDRGLPSEPRRLRRRAGGRPLGPRLGDPGATPSASVPISTPPSGASPAPSGC